MYSQNAKMGKGDNFGIIIELVSCLKNKQLIDLY